MAGEYDVGPGGGVKCVCILLATKKKTVNFISVFIAYHICFMADRLFILLFFLPLSLPSSRSLDPMYTSVNCVSTRILNLDSIAK